MTRGVAVGVLFFPLFAGAASPDKTVITSRAVKVLQRGQAVEFTGDVVLTQGGDRLTADRLITVEGNTVARAWGRVTWRREAAGENVRWDAQGDEAAYDTERSSGTLWGRKKPARAARTPLAPAEDRDARFDLAAERISFQESAVAGSTRPFPLADADGGVYLRAEETRPRPRRTELWAAHAAYDGARDRLALTGAYRPPAGTADLPFPPAGDRPFARQVTGRASREVSGETVSYRLGDRRLTVERGVSARILFEPPPAPVEKKKNVPAR